MVIGPGFLFVHIAKTGGTSVANALVKSVPHCYAVRRMRPRAEYPDTYPNGQVHFNAAALASCLPVDTFRFAFVRNPWARFVSWYHWVKYQGDFPNFMKGVLDQNLEVDMHQDATQSACLAGVDLNFVGRFEFLDDDWLDVSGQLGISAALPHLKKSKPSGYAGYYSDALRDAVADRESLVLEMFPYKFGE